MVIVAGHLIVDPAGRESYLADCVAVVEMARAADGCLDFAISPDVVDPGRINLLERWETQDAVNAFRGSGPGDDQGAAILKGAVAEFDVDNTRQLF